MSVARLRNRGDFLRVARANRKIARPGVVLQAAPRPSSRPGGGVRYGLTASRKVGNAVTRNRARRRLRALAEELLPACAAEGWDYVLIARQATPGRPWKKLRGDLLGGLEKLGVRRPAEASAHAGEKRDDAR